MAGGTSGAITLSSSDAVGGAGGAMTLSVGNGNTAAGAAVAVTAGAAAADATTFHLEAKQGSSTNGVLQNDYLFGGAARTVSYTLDVDLSGGNYSYKEDTTMEMSAHGGAEMHHTDENTLQKV